MINLKSNQNKLHKTTLEELKEQLLSNSLEKKKNNSASKIKLDKNLIDYFLSKIDPLKFLIRVIEHFKIENNEHKLMNFYKNQLGIKELKKSTDLNSEQLLQSFKEKDMPNIILNLEEKKQLINLYLTEYAKKIQKKIQKKEKEENDKKTLDEKIMKNIEERNKAYRIEILKFIYTLNKFFKYQADGQYTKEQLVYLKKMKNKSEHIFKIRDGVLDHLEKENFYFLYNKLNEIFKKSPKQKKIKSHELSKQELIETEKQKTLEYLKQIQEFKEKQKQELLKKIEDRKNRNLVEDISKYSYLRTEPIVIEAFSDDFNSNKSRFTLSVLTAENIQLSFYNGLIKLIKEDDTFDEIYFYTFNNLLKFSSDKFIEEIEIDISSRKQINDILLKQCSSKKVANTILDCLSILHYINTFYNENEKIEISIQHTEDIKTNNNINNKLENKRSIVYLTKEKKSVRTIKIKKGKRKVEGAFLIRGHWRRQKYLAGEKLIWINPFWKGIGKEREKTYKILKSNN